MSSKPCLETLPCHIIQTPSAGHFLDTPENSRGIAMPPFADAVSWCLQHTYLSKKGPRHGKNGGRSQITTAE